MEPKAVTSRRQRNAKSRPGAQLEFQFVNVKPNAQDQKTKIETRSFIRGNAAHFHWRHNRPPKDVRKPVKSRQIARPSSSPASEHPSEARERGAANGTSELHTSKQYHDKQVALYHYHDFDRNTQLGFGIDPFPSYDSELPRDLINRCIDYSKLEGFSYRNFDIADSLKTLNSSYRYYFLMAAPISRSELA
jgi:hypothetical protein